MRTIYGWIAGILTTTIAGILYLAVGGGEMLLRLSPEVHDLRSRLRSLEKAEAERERLLDAFSDLEKRYVRLSERFSRIVEEPGARNPVHDEAEAPAVEEPPEAEAPAADLQKTPPEP